MASSATAIASRCRRCWPASQTRSPTKAFSISLRARPGMPIGSGGGFSRCCPNAAGLQITAVLADAEFGDVTAFRRALHRWRLLYAVGVSRHLTVFPGTPAVHVPPSSRTGRPRSQLVLVDDTRPIAVSALALTLP